MRRPSEAVRDASSRTAKLTHQHLAFSCQHRPEGWVLNANGLVGNMGEMAGHALSDAVEMRTSLAPDLCLARVEPLFGRDALLAAIVLLPLSLAAAAQDISAARGRALAGVVCAQCHAVRATSESPTREAPPFHTLAGRFSPQPHRGDVQRLIRVIGELARARL